MSHDSHNLIVVATNYKLHLEVINEISDYGEHYFTNRDGDGHHIVLIVGLISTKSRNCRFLKNQTIFFAKENGCNLEKPFMSLKLQCLLVIPSLKINNSRLFDNKKFEFVDLIKKRK